MGSSRLPLIAGHQVRLMFRDPGPVIVFVVIPLLVMAVLKNTEKSALIATGYRHVTGAEQVVPGLTFMFAFFWLAFVGRTFFAEHGWGTWERLQAMANMPEIVFGKLLPALVIIFGQMVLLFVVGDLVFGLKSRGPLAALVLVSAAMALCVLALTFMIVSFVRTLAQLDAISSLLMMLFAALGGSLTPSSALPEWAQKIEPAIPTYWATKAAREVILNGRGVGSVVGPMGVLLAFAAGFTVLATVRFRPTERKMVA